MAWSKEERLAYAKEYYQKNKEKLKGYTEKNKDKFKEYQKKYYKTPAGIKSRIIGGWKDKGIITDDYDVLYDRYLDCKNCEDCGCEYGKRGDGSGKFKCLDHDHETGLFRNFLCCGCNRKRN